MRPTHASPDKQRPRFRIGRFLVVMSIMALAVSGYFQHTIAGTPLRAIILEDIVIVVLLALVVVPWVLVRRLIKLIKRRRIQRVSGSSNEHAD